MSCSVVGRSFLLEYFVFFETSLCTYKNQYTEILLLANIMKSKYLLFHVAYFPLLLSSLYYLIQCSVLLFIICSIFYLSLYLLLSHLDSCLLAVNQPPPGRLSPGKGKFVWKLGFATLVFQNSMWGLISKHFRIVNFHPRLWVVPRLLWTHLEFWMFCLQPTCMFIVTMHFAEVELV